MYNGIGLLIDWEYVSAGVLEGTYGEMPMLQDTFYIYPIRDDYDVQSWLVSDFIVGIGDAVLQRCAAVSDRPLWHKRFSSVAEAKRYAQYGDRGVVGNELLV